MRMYNKLLFRVIAVVSMMLFLGCAYSAPKGTHEMDTQAKQFLTSPKDARIYIRVEDKVNLFLAPVGRFPIQINGQHIGSVCKDTFLVVNVPSGISEISSNDLNPLRLNLQAGSMAFVKCVVDWDSLYFEVEDVPNGKQAVLKRHVVKSVPLKFNSTPQSASLGTGWLSASGYIVTNQHVVGESKKVVIIYKDKKYPAIVVSKDDYNDVALLSVAEACSLLPALRISNEGAQLGQRVFTVGFPHPDIFGNSAKFLSGEINSLMGMHDDPRFLQTSISVHGGNSGGPLINSEGEVAGMVSSKINTLKFLKQTGGVAPNVSYVIKAGYIQLLIDSIAPVNVCENLFSNEQGLEKKGLRVSDLVVKVVAIP